MHATNSKDTHRKPGVMKIVLVFMIICIICSFVCNLFLYYRIVKLKRQIESLDTGRAATQYLITEVDYELT